MSQKSPRRYLPPVFDLPPVSHDEAVTLLRRLPLRVQRMIRGVILCLAENYGLAARQGATR